VIHDYLYTSKEMGRDRADYFFLLMMKELGVGAIKRRVMHRAVRMFGGFAWRNK